MRRILLCLVALAMVLVGPAAAKREAPQLVEVWVRADITIDPQGRITALEWKDTRPLVLNLARGVEPTVRALEFEPGRLNGEPAVTETSLLLTLHLSDGGENGVRVAIARASTGARVVEETMIRYPVDALRGGFQAQVVLVIATASDGTVVVEDTSYTANKDNPRVERQIVDAASKGVAAWKYRLERVGEHVHEARMSVTVTFCIDQRVPWCDSSPRVRQLPSGESVPADQSIALDSAVRLKTDLASLQI